MTRASTFALYFGTRGFFPSSLIRSAREEMVRALHAMGHQTILPEESATPYGAVETAEQGRTYARFLEQNRGRFDGVILCLPNFGDENGAAAALKQAGVPILIQAYPDELDKLGPRSRRDSFFPATSSAARASPRSPTFRTCCSGSAGPGIATT